MTAAELRTLMTELQRHVRLEASDPKRPLEIVFEPPTADVAMAAGLDADGYRRLLAAPWWAEMVEEILETPEFCDPADPPERVLEYARDVVVEYLRKRVEVDEV